jgi:hypothetical protein
MSSIPAEQLFAKLPASLRAELIAAFKDIEKNYREGRWEPSELDGGKLAEIVFSILDGYIKGAFPFKASKPPRFKDSCENLEKAPATFPRSVRTGIPRALVVLYDVRNHRSVGHVGGDVNPNRMDASLVLALAKWVMAELVRVFHSGDTLTAAAAVETITERTLPVIWEIGDVKRVLNTALSQRETTLLLIYPTLKGVLDRDLAKWLEVSRLANYRRVLVGLHKDRLLEFNPATGLVQISPAGSDWVEKNLLA